MKTTIVITLYILGAIIYAGWCFSKDTTAGIKLRGFEEEWKIVVGLPVITFRLLIMAMILSVCMVWPVWLVFRIKKDLSI